MARMLHTAYGVGEVIAEDTERGSKSYLVKGAGWQVWVPETQVRTADAPVDTSNSVTLPYDPTPQHQAYPATESTILPGEMTIDADERTSPADSLTFDHAETSEAGPYPGPAPHLFARRTAGERVLPWTNEDWERVEENRLPEDDYAGHPDSLPYPPTEQDYAEWEARHPHLSHIRQAYPGRHREEPHPEMVLDGGEEVWDSEDWLATHPGPVFNDAREQERYEQWVEKHTGQGELGDKFLHTYEPVHASYRPAGLSDKYADVHGYVDPMSVTAQLADDPIGFMERKAAQWEADHPLDPRIGHAMDLEAIDPQIRTAAWKDVREKAKRLRREGNVTVHESNPQAIYASVVGDHGTYETVIVQGKTYNTGGNLGSWICECPWGRWAFKRKVSYVGRFCSHALATYMEMRAGKPNKKPRTVPYGRSASLHEAMPYTEDGYVEGDGWIPGEDFDPNDRDEMDIMRAVWEQEKADRIRAQGSIHEAVPLSLRPRRLTPDFIVNDTDEPITEVQTVDVEEDERTTTGPDQIVHFAAQFSDPDASPIDATAEAAGNLDQLRSMSADGTEGWEGRMDERTDQLRDLVDDLRAQGVDASPLVASMQRQAFNPLDLASMFFDPDTGELGDPTGVKDVVSEEVMPNLKRPVPGTGQEEKTPAEDKPMASSDPQAASGVPVDPTQPQPVIARTLLRAFLSEPFNGSGPDQKEWIGSSDDYVATHTGPMVDVTDLGDEPIVKYTEGREASRRKTADCVEDFLSWCEDEGVPPSNTALQEYSSDEALLTDELWEIETYLNGQRQARRKQAEWADSDAEKWDDSEETLTTLARVFDRGMGRTAWTPNTVATPESSGGMDNFLAPGPFGGDAGGTEEGGEAAAPSTEEGAQSGSDTGVLDTLKGVADTAFPGTGQVLDMAGQEVGNAWNQTKSLFGASKRQAPDDFGFNGEARLGSYDRTDDNSDVVREFHAKMGDKLDWLKPAGMPRVAGRVFSPVEQDELIREAHPQGARNLDQLDLDGTHYLAGW